MQNRFRTGLIVGALVVVAGGLLAAQSLEDIFFDGSALQEIRLAINERDWASLKEHFQENTYYPADLRWRDQIVRGVGIRSRGTGSRRPQKPGLRVDPNHFTAGQLFIGLKSFLLRNNSQDASNLRERLAMLFFRRMGLQGAERESHTRLYVRDVYAGLFTIVESPDKDFLQKTYGENGGHLYEFHFDNEAVLAGAKPFVFQYLGDNPAAYVPTPFKPETLEDDPQGEVIARFMQTINDTNAAAWRINMSAYLDLPKFIRHLAIENFMAEEDGLTGDYGPNNFYIYRFNNTTRFQFIPWDKSNAFWDANFSVFRNIVDGPEDHRNRLVLRAFQEADLYQLYLDTLLECANSADAIDPGTSQPWLQAEVQREYQQIRQAALEDTLVFTNAEFEAAIVDLMNFARDRGAVVRAQVAAARR
jgi:spore coat protein CotH